MTTLFTPATWNPADKGSAVTLSGGNLEVSTYQTNGGVRSTKYVDTGKWYFEIHSTGRTGIVGVGIVSASLTTNPGNDTDSWSYGGGGGTAYWNHGSYGADQSLTLGQYIGVAVDMDSHTLDFYIDGALAYSFTGIGAQMYAMFGGDTNGTPCDCIANFGASTFAYGPPSGYYAGFGDIVDVADVIMGVNLPSLSFAAANAGPTLISLPALQFASNGGANATVTLPKLGASIKTGAFSEIALPSITARATAHDSTGEQAISVTLPSLAVTATLGGTAKLSLPKLSAAAAATGTVWGSAEATLPSLTASADGRTSAMATADIALPAFVSKSYSGAVCSITIDNKITMAANVTTGGVASAQVTLPLFEATAIATANAHGSAAIVLPSLAMGTTSRTAATLPSLTLTAIGSATITATYEAYAINLGHRPRVTNQETPINEVTHYTNFPFTHVVRYKNSYYGANSTGLYLLEGTTDAGTAIPWAMKTAMDDFKTPVKKTVAAAYFGGRFGPASTVQLHAGEDTPNTYSYSTPRDALAQNHRQVFGKGVKERYFALGASGTGTCELDTIELETHNLSRRI